MERLAASPAVLNNTYLIYTTDNGYHIGQHRLPPGKGCNIEEDVNIPFFIRGPGVPRGAVQTIPSSHTDIVPTLFSLAGIPLRDDFDGEPMAVTAEQAARSDKSEHVNIEFWGEYLVEGNGFFGASHLPNNTYKHVRVVGGDYDVAYAVWCTNEHELYDMTVRVLPLGRRCLLTVTERSLPARQPVRDQRDGGRLARGDARVAARRAAAHAQAVQGPCVHAAVGEAASGGRCGELEGRAGQPVGCVLRAAAGGDVCGVRAGAGVGAGGGAGAGCVGRVEWEVVLGCVGVC